MSRRAEPATVPPAQFRSYYGQPVLKQPAWKAPDVPLYLFLGGLAGASSAMAALAQLTGRDWLARAGRLAAGAGVVLGTGALIHDLGRPERFLHMLRVFKPTSPLNLGSWLLSCYGTLAGAAAASEVTGLLPGPARLARAGAALLGPPMMTYTAVLVADTAVPAWHEAYRELPFVFAGGALMSGAGVGLLAAPPAQAGPARAVAVAGAVLEGAAERRITARRGLAARPYHRGRAGAWMRAGQVLAAAGSLAALSGRRSRLVSGLAGGALLAAALCTRFGVFEAGRASAADPVYTVVPQRERLARRAGPAAGGRLPVAGHREIRE